jgi:hypothetical protein
MGETLLTPATADGAEPELEIARDLIKRAVWVAPAFLVLAGLIWGVNGVISTAFALAIVVVNFFLAAFLNSRAARISLSLLAGVAMFGFLLRLSIVFVAFWLTRDASWMKVVPFGLTVVVAHLGLLFWEMKYVSATLAFPGLKPSEPGSSSSRPSASKES